MTRANARDDALSGLTGALIVLPQAVAFATIAGLPPEYGLYAAMMPAIVAALFGSSWHLVSGPTTAISIAVFASVSPYAPPGSPAFIGLVLTLTFLTGPWVCFAPRGCSHPLGIRPQHKLACPSQSHHRIPLSAGGGR